MTDSTSSPETLQEFAETIVKRLAASQAPDGRLRDPVDGTRITPQEYAQTSFATAAARIADSTGDDALFRAALSALDLFLEKDLPNGHADEFDTFALQELLQSDINLPEDRRQRIEGLAAYRAGRRTEQGNNWLLLQTVCRHRSGGLRNTFLARRFIWLSRAWEGPDGLLADQPRRPRETRETPLVYHAKMSMCLVRLTANGVAVGRRADRALQTLNQITRPDGEFGYFGRSENTLFGYASALDAVVRRQELDSPPAWLANLEQRLLFFIGTQFDPTVVNVQPTTDPAYDPIDGYVKRGVYGSYSAMLFSGLPNHQFPETAPNRQPISERSSSKSDLESIPFRHESGGTIELTVSTTGQVKQTNGGPDPRYAGGIPVAMTAIGDRVVTGVPSDYRSHATLPFLPRVDIAAKSYVPVTWTPRDGRGLLVAEAAFHRMPTDWGHDAADLAEQAENAQTEAPQISRPRRLLRRLVSQTTVERIVTDRRKRPTRIPVALTRAIHAEEEFVLIQDQFAVNGDKQAQKAELPTITPASVTVLDGFAEAVTRRTSDEHSPGRSLTADHSHWGSVTWVTADSRSVSDSLSVATLIDPMGSVREFTQVSTASGTATRVETVDTEYEFECPSSGIQ